MKKILSLVLAVLMAVSCLSMTVLAAEVPEENALSYEFEITSEMPDEGYIAVPRAVVDQTFTMTTSHRGADRTYSGSNLEYVVRITDANGNAVNNVVAVALHDYNHTAAIHTNEIQANGGYSYYTLPIVANRVYYFKYTKISGTTRTLRVNMQINSY